MEISKFIDEKLDLIRDKNEGKLVNVSDDFVFAYGPYMTMKQGYYESDADEIAKTNSIMQIMVQTAYLIRSITSGSTYADAKKKIKDFILNVDKIFPADDPGYKKERDTLLNFGASYLSKIREDQRLKGDLESFMTSAAPIVPYSGTLARKDLMESTEENKHVDISEKVQEALDESTGTDPLTRRKYILNLLLDNLAVVMMNYELCRSIEDPETRVVDLKLLDDLLLRSDEIPDVVKQYYFMATINYFRLPNEVFDKYLNFFKEMGDTTKMRSQAAFEALILGMAEDTSTAICTESWEDPDLLDEADAAIIEILNSAPNYRGDQDEDTPRYDLNTLDVFINTHRFMKFEEYPNRLFATSAERSNIVNINYMGEHRNYYEMSNNTVACPFLDLRDYSVKVVVLFGDTNKVTIFDDIHDIY